MNTAAVIAFLVVTSLYLEFEFKGLMFREATHDLETRANLVRDNLNEQEPDKIQEAVARQAQVAGTRVTVISRSGIVRADSEAIAVHESSYVKVTVTAQAGPVNATTSRIANTQYRFTRIDSLLPS